MYSVQLDYSSNSCYKCYTEFDFQKVAFQIVIENIGQSCEMWIRIAKSRTKVTSGLVLRLSSRKCSTASVGVCRVYLPGARGTACNSLLLKGRERRPLFFQRHVSRRVVAVWNGSAGRQWGWRAPGKRDWLAPDRSFIPPAYSVGCPLQELRPALRSRTGSLELWPVER